MPTVFITAPPEAAEELAEGIVTERLAACVNRVPCASTFWWDGTVNHESEVILLAKTSEHRYHDLVTYVEREHPYDVPALERFDEADVLEAYSHWVDEVTKQ